MKLHQIRYVAAVAEADLNVSEAARRLQTSQPAISRQIQLLEHELGFRLFVRSGRAFTGVTKPGRLIIERAFRVLREANNLVELAQDLRTGEESALSIGATHTQARYVLPAVIDRFRRRAPRVPIGLAQGTGPQLATLAASGQVNLIVVGRQPERLDGWSFVPLYRWRRCVVAPIDHPIARIDAPALVEIAAWPLVVHDANPGGAFSVMESFAALGLTPRICLSGADADVIKTYVRLGLGIGVLPEMAFEERDRVDLVRIEVPALAAPSIAVVGFDGAALLRRNGRRFLRLVVPGLEAAALRRLADGETDGWSVADEGARADIPDFAQFASSVGAD
jgi:LysR family cys regulon transcriptional activator